MTNTEMIFEAWEVGGQSPATFRFTKKEPIERVVKIAPETGGLYKIWNAQGTLLSRGQTLTLRKRLHSHMRNAERLCGGGRGKPTGLAASFHSMPTAKPAELLRAEASIRKGIGDKRELEAALEAAEYLYELVQELAPPSG